MKAEQISDIVAGLLKKTAEDKAVWSKGSARNQYKIQFNKGAISITRYKKEVAGPIIIDFYIFNEKGDAIFSRKIPETIPDFKTYNELFESVNKKYFKIDETIDDILSAINSDKEIGKDTSDDLPF